MDSLEALFCAVDDFCQVFEPLWTQQLVSDGTKRRQRQPRLSLSERMTILIAFHQSPYRNFQAYYHQTVAQYWSEAFPHLLSYPRFVEWIPSTLDAVECVSAQLLWLLYRRLHYGCNEDCSLS